MVEPCHLQFLKELRHDILIYVGCVENSNEGNLKIIPRQGGKTP